MTARLSIGNARLDLTIVAYQFPDLVYQGKRIDNDYDANWLTLVVTGLQGTMRARVRAPHCMLNWEVIDLASWISRVADGHEQRWPFSPIETRPEFDFNREDASLKISLESEREPLQMKFDADALRGFAAELREEVAQFRLRQVVEGGDASRIALQFRATEGMPVASVAIKLSDKDFESISQDENMRRALNSIQHREARAIINAHSGTNVSRGSLLMGYRPADPSAPLFPPPGSNVELIPTRSEMRAIFPTPQAALAAARQLRDLAHRTGLQLQFGVHFGRVVVHPNGDLGGALDTAGVVAAECPPGLIVASSALLAQVNASDRSGRVVDSINDGAHEHIELFELS